MSLCVSVDGIVCVVCRALKRMLVLLANSVCGFISVAMFYVPPLT